MLSDTLSLSYTCVSERRCRQRGATAPLHHGPRFNNVHIGQRLNQDV